MIFGVLVVTILCSFATSTRFGGLDHCRLKLEYRFKNLIGGPRMLPVHVVAVISSRYPDQTAKLELDFIPQDPINSIGELLQLKQVGGVMRKSVIASNRGNESENENSLLFRSSLDSLGNDLINRVEKRSACGSDLHLIKNNCYSFVWNVRQELQNYDYDRVEESEESEK